MQRPQRKPRRLRLHRAARLQRRKNRRLSVGEYAPTACCSCACSVVICAGPVVSRVRRFTAALDACRGANEMWVKLSNSNIFDVKAKKVRGDAGLGLRSPPTPGCAI